MPEGDGNGVPRYLPRYPHSDHGEPRSREDSCFETPFCGLPEEWRLVSLDDFLFLNVEGAGFSWTIYEASAPDRASALKFYASNRAKVLAEGIVQSDYEVRTYCAAMGLTPESVEFRFIDLRCERAEAVQRMTGRPLRQDGLFKPGDHYVGLTEKLGQVGQPRSPPTAKHLKLWPWRSLLSSTARRVAPRPSRTNGPVLTAEASLGEPDPW